MNNERIVIRLDSNFLRSYKSLTKEDIERILNEPDEDRLAFAGEDHDEIVNKDAKPLIEEEKIKEC